MQTILPATVLSKWFSGNRCLARSVRRRELPRRSVVTISLSDAVKIQCLNGQLWITRNGSSEDILVESGKTHPFPAGSRILIEALEDSDFEISVN